MYFLLEKVNFHCYVSLLECSIDLLVKEIKPWEYSNISHKASMGFCVVGQRIGFYYYKYVFKKNILHLSNFSWCHWRSADLQWEKATYWYMGTDIFGLFKGLSDFGCPYTWWVFQNSHIGLFHKDSGYLVMKDSIDLKTLKKWEAVQKLFSGSCQQVIKGTSWGNSTSVHDDSWRLTDGNLVFLLPIQVLFEARWVFIYKLTDVNLIMLCIYRMYINYI